MASLWPVHARLQPGGASGERKEARIVPLGLGTMMRRIAVARRPRFPHTLFGGRIDVRGLMGGSPIFVYLAVRQVATLEVAIGLAMGVAVFWFNRGTGGVLRWLSVLSLVAIGAGGGAGVALGSDKAFLANDAIGDFLTAPLLAASVLLGKPVAGSITHEVMPRIRSQLPRGHRVFVQITLLYVASNLAMGLYRSMLLQVVSVSEYVLYSRSVSWPLGIAMFALAIWLMARAVRADAAREQAQPATG